MQFVQIIEYTTTRNEEMDALMAEWEAESNVDGAAGRVVNTVDRDRPNTYITWVEFNNYEEAMENSARPETTAYAEKMMALCDAPPTFRNLDVTSEIAG